MVAQTHLGSSKQVVALPFAATNIGNADGSFVSLQGADQIEYPMAYPGSVIGAALRLNGTLTTGSLQVVPTINGSATSPITTPLHSDNTVSVAQKSGRTTGYTFQAGATIGAVWYKSGTVAPTTRDATVILYVLLESVEY